MAHVRRDERFIQHERGVFETCVEIAPGPFVGRLAHRQTALALFGEIGVGPFQLSDHGCGGARSRDPDVAVRARVRSAGAQCIERIDGKRKPFEVYANSFDGFGRRQFIDRGHREYRFALIDRLHGETAFAPLAVP